MIVDTLQYGADEGHLQEGDNTLFGDCCACACGISPLAARSPAAGCQPGTAVSLAHSTPDRRRTAGRRGLLVAGRQASRLSERARAGQSVLPDLHRRPDDRPDASASRPGSERRPARSSGRAAIRSCSRRRITIRTRRSSRTTSSRFARRARSAATRGTTTRRWRSTRSRRRPRRSSG